MECLPTLEDSGKIEDVEMTEVFDSKENEMHPPRSTPEKSALKAEPVQGMVLLNLTLDESHLMNCALHAVF